MHPSSTSSSTTFPATVWLPLDQLSQSFPAKFSSWCWFCDKYKRKYLLPYPSLTMVNQASRKSHEHSSQQCLHAGKSDSCVQRIGSSSDSLIMKGFATTLASPSSKTASNTYWGRTYYQFDFRPPIVIKVHWGQSSPWPLKTSYL